MAALLAGAIRGSDVIPDARALRVIAAEVLKINQWAFDKVVYELECLGLVGNIRQSGGEIVSFDEYVPLAHDDMYERLGTHWRDSHPSEREGQLVLAVDTLADAPLLVETLRSETGIDFSGDDVLSTVGTHAELIHRYTLSDGSELVASPLYAFEQPNRLVTLFEQHPADRVREVFQRVREYPGFPVTVDRPGVGVSAIMEDMIGLGLASAPTVVGADGRKRGFIILPYGLDPAYLTSKTWFTGT